MSGPDRAIRQRVAFLSHIGEVSGAERSLVDLAAGLERPFESVVMCPKPSALSALAERSGLRTEELPILDVSRDWRKNGAARSIWRVLRALVAGAVRGCSVRPDVIHANSPRAALAGLPMAALTGARLVVHVRDIPPRSRAAALYLRLLLRVAHVVICNSDYVAQGVTAIGRTRRLVTIYNPVDLGRFSFDPQRRHQIRREMRLPDDIYSVGLVAQITPWKGQLEAIRALERAHESGSEAHLVIVGAAKFLSAASHFDNAAYEAELHRYVVSHHMEDRVHFLGESEDVPAVMQGLDALLVPSWAEPFGRVVVEGMAAGIPVVATTVGGPAEIIQDGVNGLLRDPSDIDVWAEAIVMLERNEIDVRTLVANALRRAAEFALERHVASVVDVYSSLLPVAPSARTRAAR